MLIIFRLRNISTALLTGLAILFNLTISFVFAFISVLVDYPINSNFLKFDSLIEELVIVAVLAPLLETFIYQYGLIAIVLLLYRKLFNRESIIAGVILPALIFASCHGYNYLYMFAALFIGLSLNSFYIIVKSRNHNAFIYTTIVHAMCNLTSFTLKNVWIQIDKIG